MPTRLAALVVVAVVAPLATPCLAQVSRPAPKPAAQSTQLPRLHLVAEAGIRSFAGSPLEKIAALLMAVFEKSEDPATKAYRDCLLQQDPQCLPLHAHVFAASPQGETPVPVALVVDSAAKLNLDALKRELGDKVRPLDGLENAWRDDEAFVHQMEMAGGRHRLVAIIRFDGDPTKTDIFLGRTVPKVRAKRQRHLEDLRTARAWLFADVARATKAIGLLEQEPGMSTFLFSGLAGMEVALAVREIEGRPTVDLYHNWSSAPALALYSGVLPKNPGKVKMLGTLPFEPDMIMLLNLGTQGQRSVESLLNMVKASGVLGGPTVAPVLDLIRCWDGSVALYAKVHGELVRGGVVLGLEEDSEEEAQLAGRKLIPWLRGEATAAGDEHDHEHDQGEGAEAEPPTAPELKLAWDRRNSVVEAKNGLIVWGLGVSKEHSIATARKILVSQRAKPDMPAKLRSAKGAFAMWLRHGFVTSKARDLMRQQLEFERKREADGKEEGAKEGAEPDSSAAYLPGQKFARQLLESSDPDGVVYTLDWDKDRMRVRIRF
jgi:YD repeat-containing protein